MNTEHRTQTYQIEVNIPSNNDFAEIFPHYRLLAQGEGKFLFDLIMTAECFLMAKVATDEFELPAVAGLAKKCVAAISEQPGFSQSGYINQYIGALTRVLMLMNSYQKTYIKRSIPHNAFTRGEVYEQVRAQ